MLIESTYLFIGHLLAGTIKDTVTRFAHQKGHHVVRRFGWDCHGLPVEFEIDQELGIKDREQVCEKPRKRSGNRTVKNPAPLILPPSLPPSPPPGLCHGHRQVQPTLPLHRHPLYQGVGTHRHAHRPLDRLQKRL